MRQASWFVVTLVFLGGWGRPSMTHSEDATLPADAEPPKGQPTSKLYDSFDPDKVGEKYASHFDKAPRGFSVLANATITPPGDVFKLFRIKGNITDEELKKVLGSLRTDLSKLAKASGVKVVHEPKDSMGDRPIALLRTLFLGDTIEVNTVGGFYFAYEQDKIIGAVDVFAVRCVEQEGKQWKIVCAVHEPVR